MPKKAVIAIVDDDQSVREALTSLVRSLGYVAMAFECAEDLLKSRRRRRVSCVIADVQMVAGSAMPSKNPCFTYNSLSTS